jgi:hypothetical protein
MGFSWKDPASKNVSALPEIFERLAVGVANDFT